jgi:phosphoenolpyruvate-protein kinase (PTS system EI component)
VTARELGGVAASGGVAVGRARLLDDEMRERGDGGPEERDRALRALSEEADELGRRAATLRAEGLEAEADILEANRMMAEDPSLRADV